MASLLGHKRIETKVGNGKNAIPPRISVRLMARAFQNTEPRKS